jgi:carbon-monoxide dehydrogenase large subunit
MSAHSHDIATWVGRSIRRVEDPALVAGLGRFTGDLPAQKWVRFVRSPVASGKIRSVKAPKGKMVLTIAELTGVRPMLHKFNYVPIEHPILADGVVRFVGEPIAAVVAASEAEAEDIVDQVELEIEETPPVVDARAAIEVGARAVHDMAPANVIVEGRVKTPNFDRQWASAAHVISVAIRSRRQNALPMEPRGAHAAYDPSTGRITLTCSTQMPHLMRTAIADLVGMPESDLRVVAPDVGGGFGQKMSLPPEFVTLVFLARKLRSSVAWTEDRRENLIACFHSRDQYVKLAGAFDAAGKLLALDGDVLANIGAYSCFPTTCAVEPLMAMAEMPGPYDVRDYACHARGVVTNTCPMAPYRGVSRPVITFALERLMDKSAAVIGIDPVDLRRRNLITTFPYTSAMGLVFDDASYLETMELAVKALDIPAFRKRQAEARKQGRYLGIGLSAFSERTGYGTPAFAARGMEITPGWETVDLSMDPSGRVEARIGASPHGQGLRTTLSQIIADELAIEPSRISIVHGDTDRTPYGFGTFASRSLVISGGATLLAARKVKDKIINIAGRLLEASAEDIELHEGVARVKGTDRTIPLEQVARAAYHRAHLFNDLGPGLSESASYDPAGTFSNACHAVILEVDIGTGAVKIERYVVAEDAGRLINPMIAEGQIHGGVAQGIANALFEEIVYDETGNILTTTLADYLPPTCHEIPEIEIHHLETLTGDTLTQAKGLGEGGAIGAPAAIVNAINDALSPFGVSIDEIPVTPLRIHTALAKAETRP